MDDEHKLLGRISGASGIASFCSCGNAYFGSNVDQADQRLQKHRDELTELKQRFIEAQKDGTIRPLTWDDPAKN